MNELYLNFVVSLKLANKPNSEELLGIDLLMNGISVVLIFIFVIMMVPLNFCPVGKQSDSETFTMLGTSLHAWAS